MGSAHTPPPYDALPVHKLVRARSKQDPLTTKDRSLKYKLKESSKEVIVKKTVWM